MWVMAISLIHVFSWYRTPRISCTHHFQSICLGTLIQYLKHKTDILLSSSGQETFNARHG